MTMPTRPRPRRGRRARAALGLAAVLVSTTTLGAGLLAPATAAPRDAAPASHRVPDRIELPDGFQPEGITIGRHGTAYLGSRGDGDIYAVDLRSGQGGVISQGPGTPSVGLKVRRDRLYVAGGPTGTGRVVSTRTGAVLASYDFTTPTTEAPSFVNDVVLTRRAAFFTDSRKPQLYRVSYTADATRASVTTVRLRGDWVQAVGTNSANGITQSPDGRSLLVVDSATGTLFRVDPGTGVARRVDLGGASLTNGDGLLLRGGPCTRCRTGSTRSPWCTWTGGGPQAGWCAR